MKDDEPWPVPDRWQCEYESADGKRCVLSKGHSESLMMKDKQDVPGGHMLRVCKEAHAPDRRITRLESERFSAESSTGVAKPREIVSSGTRTRTAARHAAETNDGCICPRLAKRVDDMTPCPVHKYAYSRHRQEKAAAGLTRDREVALARHSAEVEAARAKAVAHVEELTQLAVETMVEAENEVLADIPVPFRLTPAAYAELRQAWTEHLAAASPLQQAANLPRTEPTRQASQAVDDIGSGR